MSTTDDHSPAGSEPAAGLWQIIEVTESDAIPRGEIRLRSTEGSIWESVNRNLEHWRGRRSLAQSQDMTRDAETAAQRVAAFSAAHAVGGVPSRIIRELTGDAELAARDTETFGRSTLPDFEQHGTVTGRFEITGPPYHQTAATPLTYDALADFMRAAGIRTSYEQLAARVETALAEARAMNLAFETGAEQCECGTWQVTWAPALERWLCSDCADDADTSPEIGGMQGVSAHLAVFDELARFCREDAAETMRILTDNLPQIQQAVRDVSREQFIADYWRAGEYVVNPAGHIHITGV